MTRDYITVFVPFVLLLYWALLLWCRNQGNRVIPAHVLFAIRLKQFAARFVINVQPMIESLVKAGRAVAKLQKVLESHHMEGLAVDVSSPLKVQRATKERVSLDPDEMFGNRRWVKDKNGRLVERYGPPQEGDEDMVRTIS